MNDAAVRGDNTNADNKIVVPMEMKHLDAVFEIERHSFLSPWSRKSLENELTKNERAVYLTALDGAIVTGYAGMWHVVNEGHITNIAVEETRRGQGVGGLLLNRLIEIAAEREMMGLTLEVGVHNLPAQRLYYKFGFKAEGIRKNYYRDLHEDAIIMWKYL